MCVHVQSAGCILECGVFFLTVVNFIFKKKVFSVHVIERIKCNFLFVITFTNKFGSPYLGNKGHVNLIKLGTLAYPATCMECRAHCIHAYILSLIWTCVCLYIII